MEVDVALCSAYLELHARRDRLYQLLAALETIDASYEHALDLIAEPIANRKAKLTSLSQRASDQMSLIESPASQAHPSAIRDNLDEGIDRLTYSQAILDDKIQDIKLFKDKLEDRIGTRSKGFSFVLKNSSSESMKKTAHYWMRLISYLSPSAWLWGSKAAEPKDIQIVDR